MIRAAYPLAPVLAVLLALGCGPGDRGPGVAERTSGDADAGTPRVVADSPVAAGAYLVRIAGCNDCHTAGWLQTQGQIPRSDWLTGSRIGFRGAWGTTYPSNLRRTVDRMSEEEWVRTLESRSEKPPMPWFNVHAMSERDMRALYRFIQSLGEPGDSVPAALPPGVEPRTPYYDFVPQEPGGGG